MGMDVRQRFRFSELIVIGISWGGREMEAAAIAPQDLHMWQHKQNQSGAGTIGEIYSLLDFPHMRANWYITLYTQSKASH